jgi:hypothetical protein
MIQVHVICEGPTEEMFVTNVLEPHFTTKGIDLWAVNIGGNVTFYRLFKPIRIRLNSYPQAYCTTFFDFYGSAGEFPGKSEAVKQAHSKERHDCVVAALKEKVCEHLGKQGKQAVDRFIPYVQMHEFEALLFSKPDILASELGLPSSTDVQQIAGQFATPEDINDSVKTAPSKRLKGLCMDNRKRYEKVLLGKNAALAIGLPTIRSKCPLFNDWLHRLESLQAL